MVPRAEKYSMNISGDCYFKWRKSSRPGVDYLCGDLSNHPGCLDIISPSCKDPGSIVLLHMNFAERQNRSVSARESLTFQL